MKTLSQQRAEVAYKNTKIRSEGLSKEEDRKKYGRWAKRLGGLIIQSGLLAAVALAEQKAWDVKKPQPGIQALLQDLVATPGLGLSFSDPESNTRLSSAIFSADYQFVIQATDGMLDTLTYYKSFCISVMRINPDEIEETD